MFVQVGMCVALSYMSSSSIIVSFATMMEYHAVKSKNIQNYCNHNMKNIKWADKILGDKKQWNSSYSERRWGLVWSIFRVNQELAYKSSINYIDHISMNKVKLILLKITIMILETHLNY